MEYVVGPITSQEYKYYMSYWTKLVAADSDQLFGGEQAMYFFTLSKLNNKLLRKIWFLSDDDGDSMLSGKEFCVAMHLVVGVMNECHVPEVLPKYLREFLDEQTSADSFELPNQNFESEIESRTANKSGSSVQNGVVDSKTNFQRLEGMVKSKQDQSFGSSVQPPGGGMTRFSPQEFRNSGAPVNLDPRENPNYLQKSLQQPQQQQQQQQQIANSNRNMNVSPREIRDPAIPANERISCTPELETPNVYTKQKLLNESLRRCNRELARALNGLLREKEQLLMHLENNERANPQAPRM